jgi:hypothetical protein
MFHNAKIAFRASPIPIKAELTGSRYCAAAGFAVNAYAPICALARKLLQNGFVPEHMLEVYRGSTLCFQVPLGTAAGLEVRDSHHGRPVFVPWRPRGTRTNPPVAQKTPAGTTQPTTPMPALSATKPVISAEV